MAALVVLIKLLSHSVDFYLFTEEIGRQEKREVLILLALSFLGWADKYVGVRKCCG